MEKNSINSNAISDVFPSLKEFAVLFLSCEWAILRNVHYGAHFQLHIFILRLYYTHLGWFTVQTTPYLSYTGPQWSSSHPHYLKQAALASFQLPQPSVLLTGCTSQITCLTGSDTPILWAFCEPYSQTVCMYKSDVNAEKKCFIHKSKIFQCFLYLLPILCEPAWDHECTKTRLF